MANLRPWILLVTDDQPVAGSVASLALERLGAAMEARHLRVVRAGSVEDGLTIARGVPSYSAVAVDWDLSGAGFGEQPALAIIHAVRERSLQVPIFLLCRNIAVGDLPLEVIQEVREYVHIVGETPEFVARRVQFAIKRYEEGLLPPYFRALKQLTEEGTYQWDAPGHMGGAAYLKHPVGAVFHQFFGENILRADIGISNLELGSWLDITGPPAESQRMAARIFGADWTFYVLAGSSGSNRIVVQAAVPQDAVVALDRNCHKSLSHAVALSQARPVYLQPSRNGYGMIGLIPPGRFTAAHLRQLVARSPLAACAPCPRPVFAVVTNPTYDGLLYHVDRVVELLAASVPRIHFDEAWYAYGKFHPLYRQRFAMGVPRDLPDRPTLFAVQSTHKMLPAFSMASYVHVSQSERGAVDWATMKEAFMMHGTTSPFYPMIASLDVATAMMADPTGPTLLREAVADAVAFRKALAAVKRRFEVEQQWFFGCFQPPQVQVAGARCDFADAPDSALCSDPSCWTLRAGEDWHGLDDEVVADDFCMLDPTKVTLLCPGTDARGRLAEHGIPGAVLARFLSARRLAIARTGDYTVLTLFSVGTTTGKWGTLLETLLSFKRLYDRDAALEEVLPELVADHPRRYRGLTLRGLCDEMHALMTELDLQAMANRAGEALPEPVLTPHEAYQQLVAGHTEDVPVDRLAGRVVALMIVPYPPGIPVLMPGERVAADGGVIVDYLRAVERYGQHFPGFARAVQNVRADADGRLWARAVVEAPAVLRGGANR